MYIPFIHCALQKCISLNPQNAMRRGDTGPSYVIRWGASGFRRIAAFPWLILRGWLRIQSRLRLKFKPFQPMASRSAFKAPYAFPQVAKELHSATPV